ncbi:MAG: phosphoglucosamine mutase, partial [Marinicella sp.]
MSKKYFGTDGIRGKVGGSLITAEFALRLGYAVGKVLGQSMPNQTFVIGKD